MIIQRDHGWERFCNVKSTVGWGFYYNVYFIHRGNCQQWQKEHWTWNSVPGWDPHLVFLSRVTQPLLPSAWFHCRRPVPGSCRLCLCWLLILPNLWSFDKLLCFHFHFPNHSWNAVWALITWSLAGLDRWRACPGLPGHSHFWPSGCASGGFPYPFRFSNSLEWLTELGKVTQEWWQFDHCKKGCKWEAAKRHIERGLRE